MTRTERSYYVIFSLYCLSWSFIAPVYPLFLISRGLDLFEINVVLAVFMITSFVFEVPTGALADLAGRKVSFLLSCVLRMAAFTMYFFATGFLDCILAEFVDAAGNTLANGALDAWAVDGMHEEGNRQPADRFFARAQMISRTVMITSGLVGGYAGQRDIALPWLVAAGGFAVTGIAAVLWMRESARPVHAAGKRPTFGGTMRDGLMAVRRAPVLLLMCTLTLAGAFGIMPVHMLWQPRMQALSGEGVWLMGWIWALINVASVVGSALIPRMLGQLAREHVLCAVTLWRAGMLAVAAIATGFYPAVVGFLLSEIAFGVGEPLMQAWINEHIDPQQRATVLSVRAMCFTLGGGAGLLCIGLVARDVSISAAWMVSAALLALTAPGFVILGRLARRVAVRGATEVDASAAVTPPALS